MLEVFRDAVKLNTKDDVFKPLGNGETQETDNSTEKSTQSKKRKSEVKSEES